MRRSEIGNLPIAPPGGVRIAARSCNGWAVAFGRSALSPLEAGRNMYDTRQGWTLKGNGRRVAAVALAATALCLGGGAVLDHSECVLFAVGDSERDAECLLSGCLPRDSICRGADTHSFQATPYPYRECRFTSGSNPDYSFRCEELQPRICVRKQYHYMRGCDSFTPCIRDAQRRNCRTI